MDHLRKYLIDDGLFLADFQQQLDTDGLLSSPVVLNMKMINYRGDMTLKVLYTYTIHEIGGGGGFAPPSKNFLHTPSHTYLECLIAMIDTFTFLGIQE